MTISQHLARSVSQWCVLWPALQSLMVIVWRWVMLETMMTNDPGDRRGSARLKRIQILWTSDTFQQLPTRIKHNISVTINHNYVRLIILRSDKRGCVMSLYHITTHILKIHVSPHSQVMTRWTYVRRKLWTILNTENVKCKIIVQQRSSNTGLDITIHFKLCLINRRISQPNINFKIEKVGCLASWTDSILICWLPVNSWFSSK